MIPTTLGAVADITGGRLHGCSTSEADAITVDGPVVTDSREAAPGSLYIARVGESADGHQFVPAAAKGEPSPRSPRARSTACPPSSSRTSRRPSSPSRATSSTPAPT